MGFRGWKCVKERGEGCLLNSQTDGVKLLGGVGVKITLMTVKRWEPSYLLIFFKMNTNKIVL